MSLAAKKRFKNPVYQKKQKEGLAEYYKTHAGTATGKV